MYSPGILQLHKPTLNLGSGTEFEGPWASYLTSVRPNIFWGLLYELKEIIGEVLSKVPVIMSTQEAVATHTSLLLPLTGMPSSGLASADPSLKSHPQCASANCASFLPPFPTSRCSQDTCGFLHHSDYQAVLDDLHVCLWLCWESLTIATLIS